VGPASPSTVPEVVARLRAIEASAPPNDGVVCFARLYREVTEAVEAQPAGRQPTGRSFLERLDVRFASLFLAAFDAFEGGQAAPSAWVPLFSQRSQHGVAPLQFALAGMNAHINRDLPVALVSTCRELGLNLADASPQHAAFEQVNALLSQVEAKLKGLYLTGWLHAVDRLVHRFHRLDDVVAMWDVARARDAAWTNGQALWALQETPPLATAFLESLDRMVGLAGRGLLLPADTAIRRVGRFLS
jgi:hypothetical protein